MTMPSDDCERATNSDSVAGHTLVSYAIRQRPDLAMANDLMLEHLAHLRRLRRAGQVLLAVRSPGSRWVSTAASGCSAPPTPTSSRPSSMRIPPLVGSSPPLFGHGSRSLARNDCQARATQERSRWKHPPPALRRRCEHPERCGILRSDLSRRHLHPRGTVAAVRRRLLRPGGGGPARGGGTPKHGTAGKQASNGSCTRESSPPTLKP